MQAAVAERHVTLRRAGERGAAWLKGHRRMLVIAAVVTVALLGFVALREVLGAVRLKDVRHALHAVPAWRIWTAIALTALSYFALTFYDLLAVRTIGRRLPWRTAALASFTSYTISHNLGLSLLTGGSARYRVYSTAGLELPDIARITLIASATFWGGVLGVGAVALLVFAQPIALGPIAVSAAACRGVGTVILIAIAALFVARARGMADIGVGRFTLPVPAMPVMAAQIGVAGVDLFAAASALFILVPSAAPDSFGLFFIAYVLALIAALIAHVPGGLGIFEAVILATVPEGHSEVFAALLLYRLIYYLLPLASAAGLLGVLEGRRLRHPIAAGLSVFERISRALAPPLLALLVFAGGLVLLVSGALPAVHGRMESLSDILPLPFVEASHFSASIAGMALLLIAPAINARLRSGFHAARIVLVAGALFSLMKGVDYEEAIALGVIAAILQYCRPAFYRRAGVFDAPLQRTWLAAAAIVVALSLWAGFFAYKRVPYSEDLWWMFAWKDNEPRFLRATLGAAMLLGWAACWRLLSAPVKPEGLTRLPDDVARLAFAESSRADAALAYTGDKQFILSASRDAFLMYRVQGRTWVVMGDPVGPVAAWPELAWRLRDECDAAHGRLCFYQASEDMLPVLVELGLQVMKYGEEAVVPLTASALDFAGPAGKTVRHAIRRAESVGVEFSIIPAAAVAEYGPALQQVSDAWLTSKTGDEKTFSVGRFDPDYLARFDCAVLRLDGRIVAFANIWSTVDRSELSVDMMRHDPEMAPYGAMDYLLVSLMRWGAAHGYATFNLGLAPLSGLSGRALAPNWSRIGHAIYGHAEAFYGFSGLRSFKAKFSPNWVPRYIGAPSGLPAARAMIDVVALIGG